MSSQQRRRRQSGRRIVETPQETRERVLETIETHTEPVYALGSDEPVAHIEVLGEAVYSRVRPVIFRYGIREDDLAAALKFDDQLVVFLHPGAIVAAGAGLIQSGGVYFAHATEGTDVGQYREA